MVDAEVLAAISRALDLDGDVEHARAALRKADPLLRRAALRRLRAAYADATLATNVRKNEPHTLRLAYLLVARVPPPPGARDDLRGVRAAFDAARAVRPPRPGVWWPTALATFALLLIAVGITAALRTARDDRQAGAAPPASASAEPSGPTLRGAFATGGVPAPQPGDDAVMRALRTDVPDFLIALDRRSDAIRSGAAATEVAAAEAEMKDARAKALAPDVREGLGEEAARALGVLLSAADSASARASAGGGFAQAVADFDDALAAQGLGFFADGDVLNDEDGRRLVLVYTFRVAHVSIFASGASTVRALHLRRLDKLNWSHTLVGFTRPTLRYAAVLLDQLDEQVLDLIAPGFAKDAPVALFDPDAPAAERAAAEARAGELVRAEYGALPEIDALAAAKLGKLLGKRRALLAEWEKRAAARGATLAAPAKLRLPEGFAKSIEPLATPDERAELATIEAALDDRTRTDAFAAIREATAASVERHEVQHRLDALGKRPLPMPKTLEERVGPATTEDGQERRIATTARAELSAYLAELARDEHTPRVGLARVARFLFDRRLQGSAECYAALAILEGLAQKLGAGDLAKHPILTGGAIDRHAASDVFIALAALPPERLREAARALWETLFGMPLPELRKVAPAAGNPAERDGG